MSFLLRWRLNRSWNFHFVPKINVKCRQSIYLFFRRNRYYVSHAIADIRFTANQHGKHLQHYILQGGKRTLFLYFVSMYSLEITCCWWRNGCITFKLYHPLKGPDWDDISILEKGMSLSLCLRQNRKVSRKRVNPQGILKGWRQFLESCPTAGREVYSSNIACELPQPNEDKL